MSTQVQEWREPKKLTDRESLMKARTQVVRMKVSGKEQISDNAYLLLLSMIDGAIRFEESKEREQRAVDAFRLGE